MVSDNGRASGARNFGDTVSDNERGFATGDLGKFSSSLTKGPKASCAIAEEASSFGCAL